MILYLLKRETLDVKSIFCKSGQGVEQRNPSSRRKLAESSTQSCSAWVRTMGLLPLRPLAEPSLVSVYPVASVVENLHIIPYGATKLCLSHLYGCLTILQYDHLSPCCYAVMLFSLEATTNTHRGQRWLTAPVWEPSPLAFKSSTLHTIVACFTSRWEVAGDAAVTSIKVQGKERNYSWAFLSACKKSSNIQEETRRCNLQLRARGYRFIFTHPPSNGGSGCRWLRSLHSFRFRVHDTKRKNRVFAAANITAAVL